MHNPVVIFGTVFVLALLLACGSGSGGTSSGTAAAPAASSIGKVGDRIEANGIALTVTKASKADHAGQFLKAKADTTFVIAEVLVENVSADKAPYNLLYFKLKDDSGFEYAPSVGADQPFGSGDMAKGDKARGNVAFEVKKAAKGLVLQYQPIVIGSSDPIRVALP